MLKGKKTFFSVNASKHVTMIFKKNFYVGHSIWNLELLFVSLHKVQWL